MGTQTHGEQKGQQNTIPPAEKSFAEIQSGDVQERKFDMKNFENYTRRYFMPPEPCFDWVKKDHIDKAPTWCSVDLRDGNQALIIPMSLEEKLTFWKHLIKVGFKEIEIGFPAASETEYEFCRTLIEQDLIPDDVTIQVLTQSREHIIAKTFEALKGCKNAIVHLYNSTSVAQREQVFRKSKEDIIKIAVEGAKLCKEYRIKTQQNIRRQISLSNILPKASREQNPNLRLKFATLLSMSGSRQRTTRLS